MPKTTHKPSRGGARRGAGRPRTTGTGAIKPISCKLPEADRARAEAAARVAGVTLGEFARAAILVELDAPRLYRQGR